MSEIQGYKKAIRGEQAENEKIMGVMNKLDSEAEWMKTKMKDFADERSVLQERFELLKKSLQQTVSTQDQVYADYDAIVHELKGLEKNLEAVSREKIKVEAEILLHKAEQVTHVKGAKNLAKEAAAIQEGKNIYIYIFHIHFLFLRKRTSFKLIKKNIFKKH